MNKEKLYFISPTFVIEKIIRISGNAQNIHGIRKILTDYSINFNADMRTRRQDLITNPAKKKQHIKIY
jgi:hypothetical protein